MAEKKPTGRPEWHPTDEDREKARVLKAAGMSHVAIATALNISEPTLRKHLSLELDVGSAKVRADVIMAMHRSAMGGNVQAQRQLLHHLDALPPKSDKPKREPAKGKKEQAVIDAQVAHEEGEWGNLLN